MPFADLTHIVKAFSPACQLQAVRTLRLSQQAWALQLDFYPAPRSVILALDEEGQARFFLEAKKAGEAAATPLQLYLRAHFLNLRVARASGTKGLTLDFLPRPCRLEVEVEGAEARFTLSVPERAPFRQKLVLGRLLEESETPSAAPSVPAEDRRHGRLLKNIESDLEAARIWLKDFGPLCRRLESEPRLWAEPQRWTDPERGLLRHEIEQGHLPAFGEKAIGEAQKLLFKKRRRVERQIAGGEKRLKEVREDVKKHGARTRGSGAPIRAAAPQDEKTSRPRKRPGLWVELIAPGRLWARVGRSASENAELFRQARDRDLWFHVHGQAGAHVWIPRGQPELGAKALPTEKILHLGAQLALYNSKAGQGKERAGFVDIAERRHLRSLGHRGAEGTLEIMRSQSRHVRLEEEFERFLERK